MKKRKILITGGTRGIGQAIVLRFKKAHYQVLAPTRQELDLANPHSVQAFIRKNRGLVLEGLINNAGVSRLAGIEELNFQDFNWVQEVNVTSPLRLIQAFVSGMKKKKYGRIVNLSSIWGVTSKERRLAYSASKFALNGITKSLAVELAPYRILVNAVCPGYVDTDLTRQNVTVAQRKLIQKNIPLGRFAKPEEIANLVYYLASEENTYLTGQSLIVDGGFLLT